MEKSKYASNFCDITGQKFGRLTVLGPAQSKCGCSYWECLCECGTKRVIRARHLKIGRAKSCGCWNREIHRELLLADPMIPALELIGQKFGRLLVVAREKSKHGRSCWICVCDCGIQVTTSGKNLRDGKKKSCGCLRREMKTISSQSPTPTRVSYYQYRANAEKRGYEFSLSQEEFQKIAEQSCCYCGQVGPNGVDRAQNYVGYTIENSVPCCQVCNLMKRTQTVEGFLRRCARITEYQNHKSN